MPSISFLSTIDKIVIKVTISERSILEFEIILYNKSEKFNVEVTFLLNYFKMSMKYRFVKMLT